MSTSMGPMTAHMLVELGWGADASSAASSVLTVAESHDNLVLRFLSEDSLYSDQVNTLIAKAREGGPALLAAWHRDRGIDLNAGGSDAEA